MSSRPTLCLWTQEAWPCQRSQVCHQGQEQEDRDHGSQDWGASGEETNAMNADQTFLDQLTEECRRTQGSVWVHWKHWRVVQASTGRSRRTQPRLTSLKQRCWVEKHVCFDCANHSNMIVSLMDHNTLWIGSGKLMPTDLHESRDWHIRVCPVYGCQRDEIQTTDKLEVNGILHQSQFVKHSKIEWLVRHLAIVLMRTASGRLKWWIRKLPLRETNKMESWAFSPAHFQQWFWNSIVSYDAATLRKWKCFKQE